MNDESQTLLNLLPRRQGDPHPEFDLHYRVVAERGWLLTGVPEALDVAASALMGVSERISDEILILTFGNAIGYFDVPGLGRIEVQSGKWSSVEYDQMLAELTEVATALPFAATSSAALPYDRSVVAHEDVLYHMFVYIRHALLDTSDTGSGLLPALRNVLRDPYRRFERTRRTVPLEQIRNVDSVTLTTIVSGRGEFSPVPAGKVVHGSVAQTLRGSLPQRADERHTVVTVDTPENRFMKAFAGSMIGIIDGMRTVATSSASSAFTRRIAYQCDQLDTLLGPIARHPLWRDVGPMTHLPAASPVLQRRRGYREAYRHFAKLRMSTRIPLDPKLVRDLLEAKDIALLYEVWCYFAVVRELTALFGSPQYSGGPRTDPLQVTIPWEIECVWQGGVRLLYNPRFSRSRLHQHSFSVPLRPDIALQIPAGPNAGLHLLDAKFKVDRLSEVMPLAEESERTVETEADERHGIFTRADLYKMHTYRDAIPLARSVWIMYPGTEVRFFSEDEGVTTLADSLPSCLRGVGAVSVRPDTSDLVELRKILARLLGIESASEAMKTKSGSPQELYSVGHLLQDTVGQ